MKKINKIISLSVFHNCTPSVIVAQVLGKSAFIAPFLNASEKEGLKNICRFAWSRKASMAILFNRWAGSNKILPLP